MSKNKTNPTEKKMTPGRKAIQCIMKSPAYFLKLIYIIPFFLFGLWLLHNVYFPRLELHEPAALAKINGEEDIFKRILKQTHPVSRGHFHMIDEYISMPEPNPPLCVVCHGTYPHSKEKKVRSILNAHTGFIACAVCHARRENEKDVLTEKDYVMRFLWVDRQTGEITERADGEYGKYSAKIYPIKFTEHGPKRVFRPVSETEAQQFLKFKDQYTPDQTAQAKIKLHERISEKPVFCSDCHQKESYLDYEKLGFPRRRIDYLISTEVIGMIDKYKTFYLPSPIDFGVIKSVK